MKDGFRVIDGDAHMQEPMNIWEKYVEPAYRDRMPNVIGHVGKCLFEYGPCEAFPEGLLKPLPDSDFEDMAARYGEAYESWWTLSSRLRHMDSEGIDIMIGFPTNGRRATSPNIGDAKLQAALCRAYNDWSSDFCADSHGRVKFIAQVTILDVGEALTEITRVRNRPEVAAIALPDPVPERMWSSPDYDPLWSLLVDSDLAACFHGGNSQRTWFKAWSDRDLYSVAHAASFPIESMMAIGTMIFGGVLKRFPRLRVGSYEANIGWVPWWLGRMDDHAIGRQARFMKTHLEMKPSEYFKRQCFVAADSDEPTLAAAVEALGGDNILFNSDYPHPDAPFPGSVDMFLANPIANEAKRKVLWDNSIALYGERVARAAVVGA